MTLESIIVIVAHAILAPTAVIHALLNKRDSRAALGWIGFCVVFPLVGPMIYAVFGVNRVHTRAKQLKPPPTNLRGTHPSYEQIVVEQGAGEPDGTAAGGGETPPATMPWGGLQAVGYAITGNVLSGDHRVAVLHNGEAFFPAMLEAIAAARRRVSLCTYIFDTDAVGRQFIELLSRKVREGVEVRVIVDGIGECYSWPRASKLLRKAKVPAAQFMPLKLLPPNLSINLRNHRKILVIDGETGFTGGANIGSRHLAADPDNHKRVLDTHFCLRGPVAGDLEALFLEDWRFLTGETVAPGRPPDAQGVVPNGAQQGALCRLISDGPNEDLDRLALLIMGVISSAKRRVDVMTPYFLPEQGLIGALRAAVLRGVQVRVVLPGKNNLPYVHWANRHLMPDLLEWGVRAFYQPPPFDHGKLMLIDDDYTLIGSANLDARSLRLNFELGVEIFDPALNRRLSEHFRQRLAQARELTMAELRARSFWQQARDASVALFSPYF